MLKRSSHFAWAAFVVSLVGVGLAHDGHSFAGGVLLSTFVFAAVLTWIPRCRPRLKPMLCPWNWALFVFALQLIGMPLLITLGSPVSAVLPSLPSATAINLAMVLNCLVFLTVCGVYNHLSKVNSPPAARPDNITAGGKESSASPRWIAMSAGLGMIGLILSFGDFGTFLDYFNDPTFYRDYLADASSTWGGLAALLLKPFLGFAIIAAWCRWIDFESMRSSRLRGVFVTIFAIVGTILSFASSGYNRGAFAVPLVAIAGIVIAKADRFSKIIMVAIGFAIVALMPAYAIYRSGTSAGEDFIAQSDLTETVMENIDISDVVQMYGGAPQYLGFLLERSHWVRDANWGGTTISSILSPVPVLGKRFRQQSGFAVYNRMIYGTDAIADQNASFAGEAFLDFHIVGVVVGFAVFGWVLFRLQQSFDRSRSSLELYIWQYLSIWISFVIFGGIEVPSQILIYSCSPIYLFWLNGRCARSCADSIYAVPAIVRN